MHIVVFSDIHLANWNQFSRIDEVTGLNTRMLDGMAVLDQIGKYCVQENISTVLFGGDMFDVSKKTTPDILTEFADRITDLCDEQIGREMFVLPGQHDYYAQAGDINALNPFKWFYQVLGTEWVEIDNSNVVLISCLHKKGIKEQRAELDKCKAFKLEIEKKRREYSDWNPKVIFLGHFLLQEILEEDGVHFKDLECPQFNDLPPSCDIYLLGDYHPHVWLSDLRVMSIGATNHHSFKDKNRPPGGFIDLDTDTMTFKRIETLAPMFLELLPGQKASDPRHFYAIPSESVQEEDKIRNVLGEDFNYVFKPVPSEEAKDEDAPRLAIDFSMAPDVIIREFCHYKGMGEEVLKKGLELADNA